MSNSNHRKIDLTFAKRLEETLIKQNIYPSQLAKLSGISRTNIYNYIAGTGQPTAFNIKRIAMGLNVSADYLLGLTDKSR